MANKRGEAKVKTHESIYTLTKLKINPAIKYKSFDSKKTTFDLDEKMQSLINEGDNNGAIELTSEIIRLVYGIK